jgi:hypothetical protein
VEAKGGPNRWIASSRYQAIGLSKVAHVPIKNIAKLLPIDFVQIEFIALRISLVRWSEKCSDRLLSVATSPAWRRTSATLLRLLRRPLDSVRASYSGRPILRRAFRSMIDSMEWPRRKAVVLQWLNQPFNPMQWIVPSSRLFEARRGASYKKM